jgi:hypothetical protein
LTTRARKTRAVSSESDLVRMVSGRVEVADVCPWRPAGERADGRDHAAVVLEVVVRVGDVMFESV